MLKNYLYNDHETGIKKPPEEHLLNANISYKHGLHHFTQRNIRTYHTWINYNYKSTEKPQEYTSLNKLVMADL